VRHTLEAVGACAPFTPARSVAAAARSWPAALRETSTRPAPRASGSLAGEHARRSADWQRSARRRRPAEPGRGRSTRPSCRPVSPRPSGRDRFISSAFLGLRKAWALWISLWTGVHSARPLIPCVVRGWWGAWIRPRPPHVHSSLERSGSDPVPPRSGGWGSADGRERGAGTGQQRDRGTGEDQRAAAGEAAWRARGKRRAGGSEAAERRASKRRWRRWASDGGQSS
jgi:hypothetical protein